MWQAWDIKTDADLDMKLDSFKVLFAYNSGRIENAEITYENMREIFSDGRITGFSGAAVTVVEMRNQRLSYEYLLPKIVKNEPITMNLIKEVHAITTTATYDDRRFFHLGERPGRFKVNDFVVGKSGVGVSPEDVETELARLLEEINGAAHLIEPINILEQSAYFHVRFETIHPFADGNGRVGRSLMNYLLMCNNHPPLIIYNEDKQEYYKMLDAFRDDNSLEPLLEFCKRQLEKTWQKSLERQKIMFRL